MKNYSRNDKKDKVSESSKKERVVLLTIAETCMREDTVLLNEVQLEGLSIPKHVEPIKKKFHIDLLFWKDVTKWLGDMNRYLFNNYR